MALKDNLKRLRERAGYENGKELADAIGIAYPRYMTYERGSWPNEETLTKIATQLHTSIDELLGYQPPSPDDFKDCKDFIESADMEHGCYSVSVEPDNSITIQKEVGKASMHSCTFENKDVFIRFVQKLKHGLTKTHEYRFATFMFVDDYLDKLSSLTAMGYKINQEVVSMPLHEIETLVKSIRQQKVQHLLKVLSNPKNEQVFKKKPELQNVLIDNLNLLNIMLAVDNGKTPPPPIPHVGKEPDKDDGTHADQANKKAADSKASGKQKKD